MLKLENDFKVTISATFTPDLLKDSFIFWKEKLNLPMQLQFTPLNSIFEQLANPNSEVRTNPHCNAILIRFDDWCRVDAGFEEASGNSDMIVGKIGKNIEELAQLLKNAVETDLNTYIVCTCASSKNLVEIDIKLLEQKLFDELKSVPNIYTFSGDEVLETYTVHNYYDSFTDAIGHVPYKQEYYDVYGTYLIRKICSIYKRPYKVIVTDCDNTLWKGIIGEDGLTGIQVDESRKALQEFLVKKSGEGILICLCSKNNKEDVEEVFEKLDGMVLKNKQISASMINWDRKSKNIRALAQELNLGLDSFVFIDDSQAECMEVKYSLPEVLTLCLPENETEIPAFIKNIWVLDNNQVTEEDKVRTEMYLHNRERKLFEKTQDSLIDYINGIDMQIHIDQVHMQDLERTYQLMLRINQFNLSGMKYLKAAYIDMVNDPNQLIASVRAKDRFGDYGIIGLILCGVDSNELTVHNMMLSCRALCKGVEYKMLSYIGAYAKQKGANTVTVRIASTQKNKIALEFAERVFEKNEDVNVSSDFLENIKFQDYINKSVNQQEHNTKNEIKQPEENDDIDRDFMDTMSEIALILNNTDCIHQEIVRFRASKITERKEYVAPRNEIEEEIAKIWEEVLEVDHIGIYDSIFELGGESIKAIQILSRVRVQFETELSLTVLFEGELTVEKLAKATEESILNSFDEDLLNKELAEIENMSEEEIEALLSAEQI